MNLATPFEPAFGRIKASMPRERSGITGHAVRTMRWVRLEMAAASARGRQRKVNEDWHSAFEGTAPLFVVADGVGGGAMAAQASREVVSRLHAMLDGRRIDATGIDPSMAGAAGGHALVTTVGDLSRFLNALLKGRLFRP